MDIWHVGNREETTLRLWRMNKASFRVIEAGWYAVVLVNATYTLIDKRYAPLFESLNRQVVLRPVNIHDYVAKTENDTYLELEVFNHVNPDTIKTLDSTGRKVWTYEGELFVSGDLKNDLSKAGGEAMAFSLGFSLFGA